MGSLTYSTCSYPKIQATPIPFVETREDSLICSGESSGLFSYKSAFWLLQYDHISSQQLPNVQWLWRCPGTERMRFFLWLLYFDKLNTNVNRARRQQGVDALCPNCHLEYESALHLFRDCSFAREVWDSFFDIVRPPDAFYTKTLTDCLQDN